MQTEGVQISISWHWCSDSSSRTEAKKWTCCGYGQNMCCKNKI